MELFDKDIHEISFVGLALKSKHSSFIQMIDLHTQDKLGSNTILHSYGIVHVQHHQIFLDLLYISFEVINLLY